MTTDKMRLYYDDKGYVFFNVSIASNTTIEEDVRNFKILSERNRDTFDMVEFPLDQFIAEMNESNGYRVNPETKKLEFSYPVPGEPDAPQVFGPPLTEQIEELRQENNSNMMAMTEMFEINLKLEEENANTMIAVTEMYELLLGVV